MKYQFLKWVEFTKFVIKDSNMHDILGNIWSLFSMLVFVIEIGLGLFIPSSSFTDRIWQGSIIWLFGSILFMLTAFLFDVYIDLKAKYTQFQSEKEKIFKTLRK